MINIYDVNGKVLMQAEITSSAIRVEELSKSDYISLSWNSAEKVILPAGAYIVHKYKIDKVREVTRQFRLLESYEPTQSDEMSWKYTPEFQHPKMVLSKIPFFIRTRNSKNEVVKQYDFYFCGTMVTIADKLKDFLNNELKFGNAGWVINYDTTNTNAINVSFSDNDFISALTAITNAIGDNCEWHIDYDNETIHIGNVLRDELPTVVLKVGENVGIPSVNSSKEDYYNAFAVFGGTRNITQVNDKGENISSSDIKLQLSKGSGIAEIDGKKLSYSIDEFSTIDMRQNKNEQLFTKILNFSQIYPSLNTYVYNVRGREKYVLQDGNKIPLTYNADGSVKTYKTFTVWYVRMAYPTTEKIANKKLVNTTVDNGVTHYWYDFEITDDLLINGKNIGCSFEANFNEGALSTPLAGRGTNGDYVGFELTYHKEASSTHTTDDVDSSNFAVLAGDFEIIYQEDNDLIIPTNAKDMIIPKGESLPSYKCNITVLYNIAMAESIYTEDAQKRLLDAAMKEIKRLLSDLNNYSVKSYPQVFEAKNPCLQIGQKVVYDDGNGYQLNTRAQKISTNIDFEFVQEITVGNEVIKGNTAQLKEDVKEIIASGGSGSGGGGNYTTSQLRNLIGKYGISYFVSKLFDDTAEGLITFAKGLIAKGLADLMMGAKFGNNAMITELGEAVFSAIRSLDYDNAAEQGFSVEKEKNGKYHAFFTNLTIWGKAIFHELEIRKLSYSGGNIYLSGAGSKLIKVVPVKKLVSDGGVTSWVETTEDDAERVGWKCYLLADNGTTATMNDWQEGDQARCQTMGEIVSGGTYQNASNKSYWRTIPDGGVSTQNEKIYGTKTETYLDEDGNEQTKEVQVELYDGQAFAWIVVGKHCDDIDGYDDEFSVGYNGSNPAPLETRDIPAEGDTIVLDGNRHRNEHGEYDKTDRQNVIILETTGEYAPRIACYANITEYKHTITKSVNGSDKEVSLSVFETSPKGGTKINSSRFEWISDDGSTINIINYRGDWVEKTIYHKNDQVNHNNAVWVCVANSGVDVTEEPSEGESNWKKVLSGGKGEKGDDAVSYNINFVTHKDDVHNDTILYVYVVRSVGKESTSTLISNIPEISETTGFEMRVYCDGDYNENLTNHVKWSGSIQRSAWETVKNFEVRLYLNDKLVTSNSYSYGEQGTDGKDAISILVEDAPLVFDTDDSGTVPVSVTKTAKVKVMKGNTNVANDCTQLSSRDDLNSNCMCDVKKDENNGCISVSVQGNWISKNDVIVDGVNQGQVSATSGYAVAQFVYAGVVYFAQVPFSVNVAKFTGAVAFNNKQYESKFEEISTRFKNTPTNKDLTDAESRITQTARKISLSVSEKSVGRRNLLAGSAFNRQEGFSLLLDANIRGYGILMNDGVDGMNCIRVASYYDTNRYQYCGAFWGGYNTKNIRIKHGTQYTFSCWVKVDEADTTVYLEVIYNRAEIGQDRDGRPTGAYFFYIKEPNKWQLVKWSFTTDDTHEWIEANVFTSSDVAYRTFVARFCKPMLEEGDYNGWTLSTEDYDYIGGNMLDNTLSLDKSGTLYDVNGTLTPLGFGESTSIYKSFAYKLKGTVYSFSQLPSSGNVYGDTYYVSNTETCYRYNGSEFENVGNDYYYNVLEWRKGKAGVFEAFGLEANKDYVFSFMAKGTGKLTAYFYSPDTNVFVESSLGYTANTVNAQADFGLTSDWKKYWVHWRPSDSSHKYVLLRLNRTIQSSAGDAPITDCYIAQPKLEAGAVVTEYTERKSDLVDKASLKAAGVVVNSESVTLYGSQVHIKKDKNDTNDTVLIDNETGKISAGLIKADEVVARGIKAQNLEATSLKVTGNSKFGIWEITKDDTFGEMIRARGDLTLPSGESVEGSGIDYLPLYIKGGIADAASYFRVGVTCTEFSYPYNNINDFCGVWIGKAADYVCGGVKNTNLNTPYAYGYSTSYHPAGYIYAKKSSPNDPAFAINVQRAKGTTGERTAIQTNAAIRGVLAPNSMSISENQTIPSGIGVVICTNGSDMTLTLPVNPVEGQTLIIIQGSTSKVYIVPPKGDTIYWGGQTRYDTGNRFYSGTIGQFTILVFIRGAWQLQFMNTHP